MELILNHIGFGNLMKLGLKFKPVEIENMSSDHKFDWKTVLTEQQFRQFLSVNEIMLCEKTLQVIDPTNTSIFGFVKYLN